MLNLLLTGTMKASAIVLVALAVTAMLGRRSAALRHWILSAAILCAAATPALERVAPPWHLGWSVAAPASRALEPSERITAGNGLAESAEAVGQRPATATPSAFGSFHVLNVLSADGVVRLWLVGAGLAVMLLIVGLVRLAWLATTSTAVVAGTWADLIPEVARAYGLTRRIALLQSDRPVMLATWGVVRPKVILPPAAAGWPADRVRVVLQHELAHVRRGDWAVQIVADLLRAVYWFNPLVWIICARLRQESEQACDDAVLNCGVEGADYAAHLLDVAQAFDAFPPTMFPPTPAQAVARPSSLEGRIVAMLNARINRSPMSRPVAAWVVAAVLTVTVVLAGLGAATQMTFGSLSGTVVDPMGRVIPDVTLTLVHAQSKAKHEVQSDASGRYEFVGLPLGDYTLSTRFAGFMTREEKFTLAGQDARRNLSLQVGTIEETITVTDSDTPPRSMPPSDPAVRLRDNAKADPCSASQTGGCIRPPRMLRHVNPFYSTALGASGIEGVVNIEGTIGTDGTVSDLRPTKPAQADLVSAAIQAVGQWEYLPTHLDGFAIATHMQVTVNFAHQK